MARGASLRYRFEQSRRWCRAERHVNVKMAIWRQGERAAMHEAEPVTIETFDILRLLKSLPHRYPFLMIDRVIEARGDESGIGIKNVSINEPQFQGHFPEHPVMPGVLLIEGMAQTAGVLCVNAHSPGRKAAACLFHEYRQGQVSQAGLTGRPGRVSHDQDQPAPHHVVVQGPRLGGWRACLRGGNRRHAGR